MHVFGLLVKFCSDSVHTQKRLYTRKLKVRGKKQLTKLERTDKWHSWHLLQKESNTEGLSKNKQFKMIPIDPKVMNYIDKRKLGLRKSKKEEVVIPLEENVNTKKLFSARMKFVFGAKNETSFPPCTIPEVAFIGRSNVGKSSLINAVSGSNQARVSPTPGFTRQVNWYNLQERLHLVDLPGYGFAFATEEAKNSWKNLIAAYLQKRPSLKRLLLLVDARHSLKAGDYEMLDFLESSPISCRYQFVMTKADLVLPQDLARRWALLNQETEKRRKVLKHIILVSAKKNKGLEDLRAEIAGVVLPIKKPKEKSKNDRINIPKKNMEFQE